MARELRAAVCVIGAGPAGCVLASLLRARGLDVMLVERGPRYDLASRRMLLDHRRLLDGPQSFNDEIPAQVRPRSESLATDPLPYQSTLAVGVGGGSLVWAAQCPRPRPEDLDGPVGYAELEPHLLRAEHELGVAGDGEHPYVEPRSGPYPMPAHSLTEADRQVILPAARRLGWAWHAAPVAIASRDSGGRPACRRCRACDACPSGARYSADLVHVPRFEAAGGRVVARCSVRRLEVDRTGRRVTAAHAIGEDGEIVLRAERFVIATGGIEAPRLLLLSKHPTHHPDGLGNSGGALGRSFTDHYFCPATIVGRSVVQSERGFPAAACHYHRVNREHNFHFIGNPAAWWIDPLYDGLARTGRFDPEELGGLAQRSFGLALTMEARSRGVLALSPDAVDGDGDPVPVVRMPIVEHDRATHREAIAAIHRLADAMGASEASVGLERGHFWWGAHPMGGARMATDPRDGACDRNLLVFGTDNAYVLSTAVLSGRGTANPTLSVVALASRLADQLAGPR